MNRVLLGDVAEINPNTPRELDRQQTCLFVPMEAVDDYLGAITGGTRQRIDEVAKGYTYFANEDVLFAKITPCMENGKCALARNLENGVGFGSTEFHVIRSGAKLLPEWIYYFLRQESVRKLAERNMTGSAGQKRVPSRFLEEIGIPLPPLPEQQRIAARLAQADRLRRLRRYALTLGDGYLHSVFTAMFGASTSLSQAWGFTELGEISRIASGVTKGQDFKGRATVEVPYLRVANVQDGFLDLAEIKTIQALPADVAALRLQPGDVVMTEGGDFDKLGRGAVWRGEIDLCIHQNHIFRVRLDQEAMLSEFFEVYLQSQYVKTYFLQASKQTTNLATINMTQLKALPIPVIPCDQQREFAGITRRHERLRAQQREALRQAEQLFAALLQGAFAAP